MRHLSKYLLWALFCLSHHTTAQDEFNPGEKTSGDVEMSSALPVRYLLYEVNPGEGFNLRRDVYIRMANMVKFLNEEGGQQWVLVLPPWGNIYHWQSDLVQKQIPWKRFFDLESLRLHAPVIEFSDWMQVVGGSPSIIDEMYYLQSYAEGWEDGQWTERRDIRPCNEANRYRKHEDGLTYGYFWGYETQVAVKKFECLSVQNEIKTFVSFLRDNTSGQSIMIHRGETLTHGRYSEWSKEWWTGRRSMRFSKKLIKMADKFRKEYLDSDDERDATVVDPDWTNQMKTLGVAKGGPYLAVHLRRKDFLRGSRSYVPSLGFAAEQIEKILTDLELSKVFIATDAPTKEFDELKEKLGKYEVYRFTPTKTNLIEVGDGGIAVIDQWIAAHARHFIGTSVSTFSFRIHEERSLLGFAPDSTFNRLCGDKEEKCASEQPGRWFPVYV